MEIVHRSKELFYREPFGAVPNGTDVRLRCEYKKQPAQPALRLRYEAVKEAEEFTLAPQYTSATETGYEAEFRIGRDVLHKNGLYFYTFLENGEPCGEKYQITVYEKDLDVPEWFLNTVIYQIFPDRFYKAQRGESVQKKNTFFYGSWEDLPMYLKNEDGSIARWEFYGGNLQGILEKLEYIKNLGAGTVYLNPIFEAESNHRYDTTDYKKVDGLLGGDAAFDALIERGKELGVRFILDGVFNHTGKKSIYFDIDHQYGNGAYHVPDSPYRDWYSFTGDGKYACWWGVEDLPALNKKNTSYVDFIARDADSVVRRWSRRGIWGWRLDVADELPDALIREIRAAAESEIAEPVILGEVWEDASNKISYGERKTYFTERELHTHTNYAFRENLISFLDGSLRADCIAERFETVRENYPRHNFFAQVNMTGSHDVERLMSVMLRITNGEERLAMNLVKCYSLIQFTAPGVPLIYYGDETCLRGGKDPDNRRTYPWGHQNQEMIGWFTALCALRRENETLRTGDARYFGRGDGNVFAVLRKGRHEGEADFLTVCDRFGRGRGFIERYLQEILDSLEKFHGKRYIIKKEAGGYALFAEIL